MSAEQMLAVEREGKILSFIESHGKGSVSELSRSLKVSEATVRRDLRRLTARRLIHRVHGGAVLEDGAGLEPPVLQRRDLCAEEKERIGAAAAALISDGETVILMGGSTTLEVASHLQSKQDLTVITDSILIAERIARQPHTTAVVLGGIVRHAELSVEGYLTQLCLRELHAHKMIMGARAANLQQGLMLDKVSEVATFRDCARAADEVILAIDHSKFGQVATAVLGPLTMAHRIVTDSGIPSEVLSGLRELGIQVIVA